MMTIEVTMMTVMMTVDVIAREILQENVPVIDLGMITQEVMTDIILPTTDITILLLQCSEMTILQIHILLIRVIMTIIPIHLRITIILLLHPILLEMVRQIRCMIIITILQVVTKLFVAILAFQNPEHSH